MRLVRYDRLFIQYVLYNKALFFIAEVYIHLQQNMKSIKYNNRFPIDISIYIYKQFTPYP